MLHYRLCDHLGICELSGRSLMLDLRRDRYFELDPATARAVKCWRSRSDGPPRSAALALLLERGMLVPGGPPAAGPASCPVPHQSLLDHTPSPARAWPLVPEIAMTLWKVRRLLRRAGLETAVEQVRSRKTPAAPGDPLPQIGRFRAARRLVPWAPNCLADSLALSLFLARRGISFELVFGVKLDPFAAHCWLQNEEAIFNDAADSVATFTPIMVI